MNRTLRAAGAHQHGNRWLKVLINKKTDQGHTLDRFLG
jgi:hypothetical protein